MTFVSEIEHICKNVQLPKEHTAIFLGFCKAYDKACTQAGVDATS